MEHQQIQPVAQSMRPSLSTLLRLSDVGVIFSVTTKTVNKLVRENELACVPVTYREQRCSRGLRMRNEVLCKTMCGERVL
jgi:hypothetical protein